MLNSLEITLPPARRERILIIDDDRAVRDLLEQILKEDHFVVTASNAKDGLMLIDHQDVGVTLLDVMLGADNGIDILKRIKQSGSRTEVIMISVVKEIRTVVEAMKNGAFDYVSKQFDYDEIRLLVRRAIEYRRLKQQVLVLKDEVGRFARSDHVEGLSPAMHAVTRVIEKIAPLPSNVLILGESGTGKEVVARRIHELGYTEFDSNRYRPFVAVNLASVPPSLAESTLFGHEEGAFTGAVKTHRGKFELADGGTLFLDEIGELTPELQVKLLRVLQEREFERVGGEIPIRANVRVIAATNRDLKEMVRNGSFREDLYYRLNVIPITLPPLRDRMEDLHDLVNFFIAKNNKRMGKSCQGVTSGVIDRFNAYGWPGNIRELENVIERMVALGGSQVLDEEDLPMELRFTEDDVSENGIGLQEVLKQAKFAFEKRFILAALKKNDWHQARAAQYLGIHRKSLEYKIKQYSLQNFIDAKKESLRQEQLAGEVPSRLEKKPEVPLLPGRERCVG